MAGKAADAVLVARDGCEGRVVGMVTVKMSEAISQIGLLAVAETHRRRGGQLYNPNPIALTPNP